MPSTAPTTTAAQPKPHPNPDPAHAPFEVRILPLGNTLGDPQSAAAFRRGRGRGLGDLAVLPDALLLSVLDDLVVSLCERGGDADADGKPGGEEGARALCMLSAVSVAAHALASDDDLWRRVAFALWEPSELSRLDYSLCSWRGTVLRNLSKRRKCIYTTAAQQQQRQSQNDECKYYSDILFHKRRCRLNNIDPEWVRHEDIPRIPAQHLSLAEFRTRFEIPRKPVILTGIADQWPAAAAWQHPAALADAAGPHTTFNAGGFPFTIPEYLSYAAAVQDWDDQALFIFDHKFVEKTTTKSNEKCSSSSSSSPKPHSRLEDAYSIPSLFQEDMFSLFDPSNINTNAILNGETNFNSHCNNPTCSSSSSAAVAADVATRARPDFRWLIIGARRSGSSFHKDPNATSAWNAVLRGRKKWVFFPPGVTPPGVTPTADGGLVTVPVSVTEWFVNFYNRATVVDGGGLEGVTHPGDLIFVPRGWWHSVLNLDLSVALTHNFVSPVNAVATARFFASHPDQVSGVRSAAAAAFLVRNFVPTVSAHYPHLRARLAPYLQKQPEHKDEQQQEQQEQQVQLTAGTKRKVSSLWQSLQMSSSTKATSTSPPFSGGPHSSTPDTPAPATSPSPSPSSSATEPSADPAQAPNSSQPPPPKQFRFGFT